MGARTLNAAAQALCTLQAAGGLALDNATLHALLSVHARAGDDIVREMKTQGARPTDLTLSLVGAGYAKGGQLAKAEEVFRDLTRNDRWDGVFTEMRAAG
eukprot:gene6433-48345_t